jgi:hypothetical protein
MKKFSLLFLLVLLMLSCDKGDQSRDNRSTGVDIHNSVWSVEKANSWYEKQNWIIGANFTPSSAINQIEFWAEDTYDPATINRELGYAAEIGFNTMRVYLHYLVWARNPAGLKGRMNNFLDISKKHDIKIMFVLFDDCWNDNPDLGKQPEPKFGVHNSGWAQCPGGALVDDEAIYPVLKAYTRDIMSRFGKDTRVLMWDLYNEPGNFDILERSLPLLENVIMWAREVNVQQPITIGLWNWGEEFDNFNKLQAENSDIITFHHYDEVSHLKSKIEEFKKFDRPMICTEYMARTRNNTFFSHLPVFKETNIGAINWGLVSGKTNTIYMWDSLYITEPDLWFHDIFHKDGTPFDSNETKLIKELTDTKN